MPISARNKLRGKIEEIQLGDVMAHVVVRVGDNLIEIMTSDSGSNSRFRAVSEDRMAGLEDGRAAE